MASRRTRIKGIANIPQRKKTNQENSDFNVSTASTDDKPILSKVKEELTLHLPTHLNVNSVISSGKLDLKTVSEAPKELINTNSIKLEKPQDTQTLNHLKEPGLAKEGSFKEYIGKSEINENEIQLESQKVQANIVRRKFLKPGININAVKKRQPTKETTESLPSVENVASTHAGTNKDILNQNQEKGSALRPDQSEEKSLHENEENQGSLKFLQDELLDGNQDKNRIKPIQKEKVLDNNQENNRCSNSSEKVVVISEIRIPKYEYTFNNNKTTSNHTDHISNQRTISSEVTLNETHLFVNEVITGNTSTVTFSPNIKKVVPEICNVSDSEYPAPPPSPSKINRSRIKAIPRLSQRKTSCSASESEDETRKYGRIRNNSVCSAVSTTCLEPATPTSETAPTKDVMPILQKKIIRTEQSRKLAEARREFQKRFGTSNPDKQRLKMIDLIFYNPKTNPMGQKNPKPSSENNVTENTNENEENIDDPSKVENVEEKTNNAENSMPVPQIKIGPSGEIILDEQSLIVENAEIARQKEQIRNSKIVDGDFDTGYGIYKRAKRSLAWTQRETLRFYKALNLIGTDFTTMAQLFPKRTRRELKLKFKKEENINKHLIDKAIMQPCRYNFADFKREVEVEEAEEAELQKIKEEELRQLELQKQIKREKNKKDKEARELKRSVETIDHKTSGSPNEKPFKDKEDEDKTLPETINNEKHVLPPKKRLKLEQKPVSTKHKARKAKVKPLNIKSVLDDDSDADISDMDTQSESEEEETIPYLKPTRSGRMPKSTMRFTTINEPYSKPSLYDAYPKPARPKQSLNNTQNSSIPSNQPPQLGTAIRNRRSSSISSIESNSEKLVPGALVIMTEEDSKGQLEYKVFMVTPDKKMAPLELESDIIAKLIKERQNEEENPFLVPPIPEKNVTIPADVETATPGGQDQEILVMNYDEEVHSATE